MSSGRKFPWSLIKALKLPRRNIIQDQCDGGKKDWTFTLRKYAFEWSGYNAYGLYTHDVINYNHPVVREALRRLPKDMLDARNFRLIRAMQLNFLKTHLPREKWLTYEQDLEYRYLRPYIDEIHAEQNEIYEFGGYNYKDSDWPADEIK